MFTLLLVALTSVQSAAPAPSAPAYTNAPIVAENPTRSAEHIAKARKALEAGDLAEARREFVIASALDRDEGVVPVDASYGLAQVLFSQAEDRKASAILEALADDAHKKGDYNTEARALADVVWLQLNTKQVGAARVSGERLYALLESGRLSAETRASISARVR
jgi:thioredoxin-like negative regulator of GroEL